jgi:hypothetical protein
MPPSGTPMRDETPNRGLCSLSLRNSEKTLYKII